MSSSGHVSNVPGGSMSPREAAYSSVRLRREDKAGMTLSCTINCFLQIYLQLDTILENLRSSIFP